MAGPRVRAQLTLVRTPSNPFTLADWRRRVAALYLSVREAPDQNQPAACERFRRTRDALFRSHPDSPLGEEQRARFQGLTYYPYNPGWRLTGSLDLVERRERVAVDLGTDGDMRYTRVAMVRFTAPMGPAALDVYWIEGYGGGLFLPFRDHTSGAETFGRGRYLYDTIKGADPGSGERSMVLDFNYAYNPSCAYGARWVCPLAPPANALPFAVRAGERRFV